MELSGEELVLFLVEMFPAISADKIRQRVAARLPSESLDQLVDWCLQLSSKDAAAADKKEEDDAGVSYDMISLIPRAWKGPGPVERKSSGESTLLIDLTSVDEVASSGIAIEEVERKRREEEDELFARSLYEQDLKDLAGMGSDRGSRPGHDEAPRAIGGVLDPGLKRKQGDQSRRTDSGRSLADQMEEVKKQRHNAWRESSRAGEPQLSIFGKSPMMVYPQQDVKWQEQIRAAREQHSNAWRNSKLGRKRVWTMGDIEALRQAEQSAAADDWLAASKAAAARPGGPSVHTIDNTLHDPLRIGKEALRLTNEFRAKNKLPSLAALCDIGKVHSADMAEGRVPFGHAGFDARVSKFPMRVQSAAENVAMSTGLSDVARVAVDGWIHSPGHRKNLLSHTRVCGIGVYTNDRGECYLTQLFAG